MYALTKRIGNYFDVLAVSEHTTPLESKMKAEVLTFVKETYALDPEALDFLMPITDHMEYWSDDDELTPAVFRIVETDWI